MEKNAGNHHFNCHFTSSKMENSIFYMIVIGCEHESVYKHHIQIVEDSSRSESYNRKLQFLNYVRTQIELLLNTETKNE